jgi:hypothetical protein
LGTTELPEGWDSYDPNGHERTGEPEYEAARFAAQVRRLDAKEALFVAGAGRSSYAEKDEAERQRVREAVAELHAEVREAELTEFAGTLLEVQAQRLDEIQKRAAYREKLKGLGFGYRWSHSS